jgi:hypothetical protein
VHLISLLFAGAVFASAHLSLLEEGTHCVAYRAENTVMLVSSSAVVGKNCDISVQVLPEVGGLYYIEVIIPLHGFQSGKADRDEDVMKTLKSDVKPELTFKTKSMTADKWRALFAKTDFDIEGDLTIGDKSYPLKLASHYQEGPENAEVDGIARVRFQDFDLSPPKVFFGLGAKSKSDLELHFHLLGSRILGADSIKLDPKPVLEKTEAAEKAAGAGAKTAGEKK